MSRRERVLVVTIVTALMAVVMVIYPAAASAMLYGILGNAAFHILLEIYRTACRRTKSRRGERRNPRRHRHLH